MKMIFIGFGFMKLQIRIVHADAAQNSHAKRSHACFEGFLSVLSDKDDVIAGVVYALCLFSKFHAGIVEQCSGLTPAEPSSPPRPYGLGFPARDEAPRTPFGRTGFLCLSWLHLAFARAQARLMRIRKTHQHRHRLLAFQCTFES